MSTIYSIYDQVATLLASPCPAKIKALKATPQLQARLESLIEKSKAQALAREEKMNLTISLY